MDPITSLKIEKIRLQDPTLTDFNFNNLHMPPAHLEAFVDPVRWGKLCKQLETEKKTSSGSEGTHLNHEKSGYLGEYTT